MKQITNSILILILPTLVISIYQGKFFQLNLSQAISNGTILEEIGCYQADVVNIQFNSQSTWLCQSSICQIQNNDPPSKLQILYQTKTVDTYQLTNIYLSKFQFMTNSSVNIIIQFTGGNGLPNQYIYIIIPVNTYMNSSGFSTININHIPQYRGNPQGFTQKRYFYELQTILTGTVFQNKIPQSLVQTFQFLNSRDYGKFYAMKDNSNPTISYIVSRYMYQVDNGASFASLASLTGTSSSISYQDGTVICYGSNQVIVSSISKNYQLWINFFAILLFGLFFIMPRSTNANIEQEKFIDNRFTCWVVYSIFFLEHYEYYTKTARAMPYLLNFTLQSMVLSILYSKLGLIYEASMIGWAGVVAWASSIWIPYFFGCIFIRKIQNLAIIKLQMQIEERQIFRKNAKQIHQRSIVECDEQISAYYYWYYALAFLLFIPTATLSVYFTQDIPKGYEYINLYWIASIGVSTFIDIFIYELLMACVFGGTTCYQSKGMFYQSRIGQLQRQLKQNPV